MHVFLWPNSSAYEIILKSQMTNAQRCRDKDVYCGLL